METPVRISPSTFPNRANATLYVPFCCNATYQTAQYWKDFKEIVEMSESSKIADVNREYNANSQYYDLQGRRKPAKQQQKGLNIVVMEDGTTRKVVVR